MFCVNARFRIVALLMAAGCTGTVGGSGRSNGAGGGDNSGDNGNGAGGSSTTRGGNTGTGGAGGSGGSGGTMTATGPDAPGPVQLRRLTNLEYWNTIHDLFGSSPTASDFNKDLDAFQSGFGRGAAITKGTDARMFMDASDGIATAAVSNLTMLLPCKSVPAAAADQDACIKQFITDFGLRAYRRPVNADESSDLFALYTKQKMLGASFTDALQSMIVGILQSPYFLYRWELNTAPQKDGNLIKFNSYEIASRLSYAFWSTMPDKTLFDAAAGNQLQTPDQIFAQAQRMMGDDKFKQTIRSFHLQWLNGEDVTGLQKDPTYTTFTPAVAQSMLDETAEFANRLLFGPQATGKMDALFTSNVTWIDAGLAKLYGASVTGTGQQQVTLKPEQRAGILTQASFLAAHANPDSDHPVRRGVEILRHVLCVDIEIPKDIMVPPVMPQPDQTTRETFTAHSVDPKCAGCHQMIDPLGFAFEHYDAVGGWRDIDNKKMVDSSGKATIGTLSLDFKDAIGLSQQLAKSDEVKNCMGAEWLRFMIRRHEGDGDAASLKAGSMAFSSSGYDLRELIMSLTKTKAFTHRTPSVGEVF
jgi:hypothetical protein